MLKRSLSILLATLILITLALYPAHAEENVSISVEPNVLSIIDKTTAGWYEDITSRTALAACIWCDVAISDNEEILNIMSSAISDGYIYVSKKALNLVVVFFGSDSTVLAFYQPSTDDLSITKLDIKASSKFVAEAAMESVVSEDYVSSYYAIDGDDVLTVLEVIIETLDN